MSGERFGQGIGTVPACGKSFVRVAVCPKVGSSSHRSQTGVTSLKAPSFHVPPLPPPQSCRRFCFIQSIFCSAIPTLFFKVSRIFLRLQALERKLVSFANCYFPSASLPAWHIVGAQ